MAHAEVYRRQVGLLIRVLPQVAKETAFALKGGTAINLFVRDMPRLSVDIDLTYLPVKDRPASLSAIDEAMKRIAASVERAVPGSHVTLSQLKPDNIATKVIVRAQGAQVKIEVTPVLRGCVYEPATMGVAPAVEEEFGFAQAQVVSFADLYAGKIVAALDRQHPRDLFDVRDLLANEGVGDELRRAFLIYVLSHDRPIAEILAPNRRDVAQEFHRGFDGMTTEPVSLDELLAARESLIAIMVGEMPQPHRAFLIGFKRGDPDWSLSGIPNAEQLPAVQWKLHNLGKLPDEKRALLVTELEKVLLS
ncbi:MAG TPA: nucleotidyl transferase AbiEii/AbiGii toxin family protein [Allosphingosinicella sp.]|nr:nucleotidyl transferase AbiEii/AbiGii toxin family protein [Allosphingosinicella sp.]